MDCLAGRLVDFILDYDIEDFSKVLELFGRPQVQIEAFQAQISCKENKKVSWMRKHALKYGLYAVYLAALVVIAVSIVNFVDQDNYRRGEYIQVTKSFSASDMQNIDIPAETMSN